MLSGSEHKAMILELVPRFRHEFHLYDPEVFEQRIHEEKLRADHLGTSFVYFELLFNDVFVDDIPRKEFRRLWEVVLASLIRLVRGSDVKGFLAHDRGIGILFLDCAEAPTVRLIEQVRERLTREGLGDKIRSYASGEFYQIFGYAAAKPGDPAPKSGEAPSKSKGLDGYLDGSGL